MAIVPVALNLFGRADLARLLYSAWQTVKPEAAKLLSDPSGVVARVGDALVWSGPTGQKVIGSLEMLTESQARIDSAIIGIESAQLAMQGTLGVVQSISFATLGVTSLSGAFMVMRLHAINQRIGNLANRISDVEGKIDAEHKAHLRSSLLFLRDFDDSGDAGRLEEALHRARHAANIYGTIAAEEADGKTRLPVLNCRSRLYVLSLLTELRCIMATDNCKQALERIGDEQHHLKAIAKKCFQETLKGDPERYLRPRYKPQGVTLDLLTSVYKQANRLGVVDQPQIADANGMFEYVRQKLQEGEGYWSRLSSEKVDDDLAKLRYLLACLEETSKVEGLKLMIEDVQAKKSSFTEIAAKLKEWRGQQTAQEQQGVAPAVFAYAL